MKKVGGLTNRSVFIPKVDGCQCSRVLLCLGAWSFCRVVKKEGKKREEIWLSRFVQQENGGESCVASSWFCNVSVLRFLVETEKNAHTQSNAVSFAVTIFLSGLTGSELCLFKGRWKTRKWKNTETGTENAVQCTRGGWTRHVPTLLTLHNPTPEVDGWGLYV